MALVVKDRVKETTNTTGTSDFTLSGAVTGFQSFSVVGNGNTTYYAAVDSTTGAWEVGIGTYSSTGPTLTRDTVLESSNAGSKVSFAAGSKDVFVTYPAERSVYLDAAGSAVTLLDVGTLGVGTANITSANITAGTVSTTPTNSTDLVNKQYVDTIAVQGTYYHSPVQYETASPLTATYNNGSAGVGATLTNSGTLGAFTPDGVVASVGDRILVYKQSNQTQNGVYTVTTVGDGATAWVLTRATDANTYGLINPNALGQGDAFYVTSGATGAGETYVCNTVGTITFGTTNITFVQISDTQIYSAGTGLTLSGTQFSITPVGTAATYGSASQVPVLTTNSTGQVTSVTNTSIAISAGAVSGLAPSATTDTTNAANITSGTLPSARLNGSYTGVTGVGTLTAGTWNAGTVAAAYGGTGQASYTVGDLLYADTTSSLAKLADVAYGNVLLSGGVGTAPSYGKVSLTDHITGTLAVSNGGTGATTAAGARTNLGLVIGTDIPSPTGAGASGTWNISISGNAATATYATSAGSSSTPNSVTFNNSGTGAASGTGFNGSSAVTVSYNTIGAPSTTGTNASGTWGISISGNAATATSATSATSATTATTVTRGAGAIATVQAPGSGTYNFHYMYADATEFYLEAALATDSVSGTKLPITFTWRGGYATQGGLKITGPSAAALGGNTILHAGNYNTYAPTLTGGGASGTWGISISGNAATASSASAVAWGNVTSKPSNIMYYQGFTLDANTMDPNATGFTYSVNAPFTGPIARFSTGGSYDLWLNAPYSSGGYGLAFRTRNGDTGTLNSWQYPAVYNINANGGGALYATIYYDQDNTGYYVDPASTSNLNGLTVASTISGSITNSTQLGGYAANTYVGKFGNTYYQADTWIQCNGVGGLYWPAYNAAEINANTTSSYGSVAIIGSRNTWRGIHFQGGGNTPHLMFDGSANGGIYYESGGRWASYYNYSNNCWGYGTSATNSAYNIYCPTGVYSGGRVDGTIFYDSDNTAYYADPASTSNFNALNVGGSAVLTYAGATTWNVFYFGSNKGAGSYLGSSNTYGLEAYSSDSGAAAMSFHRGGYYAVNMGLDPDNVMRIGGWSAPANLWQLDMSGNEYLSGSSRAPIFYDSNDTSYYIDPASTSNVNQINMAGYIRRNSGAAGYLEGAYGINADGNSSGAIYTIGGSYQPASTSLNNMYGVGYTVGNGTTNPGLGLTGWGFYVASGGVSRFFFDSDNGVGIASASFRAPIFYDSDNTGYYVDPASTSNINGLTTATDITVFGIRVGRGASGGGNNVAVGANTLSSVTTATQMTAIGTGALFNATTNGANTAVGTFAAYYHRGFNHVAIGNYALIGSSTPANNTGNYSVAIGSYSLYANTSGGSNVAIGYYAMYSTSTGNSAVAVGNSALYTQSSAVGNTAIGNQAAYSTTTGGYNVAVGYQPLYSNQTGTYSVAIGYRANYYRTNGNNVGIGYQALYGASGGTNTGYANVGVGSSAGQSITTGNSNTIVGDTAGLNLDTGTNNTMLGNRAGVGNLSTGLTSGTYCVYIGNNATPSAATVSYEMVISARSSAQGKGTGTGFIDPNGGGVYQGNNLTTWSTTSDARIKQNFVPVTNGLEVINALEPFEFDYILTGKHDTGFKAQDYMRVLPDQVTKHAASPEEKALVDDDQIYGIQRNLDPYFVSAIKALTEQVKELQAELALLKGNKA